MTSPRTIPQPPEPRTTPLRSGDVVRADTIRVGHDAGQIVILFEHTTTVGPEQVRDVLKATQRPVGDPREGYGADGTAACMWRVDERPGGSTVSLQARLGSADLDVMASAAADAHEEFRRLVRLVDPSRRPQAGPDEERRDLVDDYGRRIAAALADTD